MQFHGLLRRIGQFIAIKLSCPGIVLLLGVLRVAVVLSEELGGTCVSADLHLSQLDPAPICVQICGPHKGQMNAQASVHGGAVDADEDTVRDSRPGGVFRSTIEACLDEERNMKKIPGKNNPTITLFVGIARNLWSIASMSDFEGLLLDAISH